MRRPVPLLVTAAAFAVAVTPFAFASQVLGPSAADPDMVPTGKGWGELIDHAPPRVYPFAGNGRPGGGGGNSSNGIFYHGGPLMTAGPSMYYIWYGNWSGNTASSILTNLGSNIGGSPYFNINTTYYDGSGTHVANVATLLGQANDNYSFGTALSDSSIQGIVANAIGSGALPADPNGVYFVLTSADVNETSGFCTQYCGWHTHASITGLGDIKYSFVGNPDRCPSACAAQTTSPNGNAGADAMASILAHELEEATTDPDLNAWYDRRGEENADKCAWTFGATSTASNGSAYNMVLGGLPYLIQRNWVNASGGYCATSY